MKVKNKSIENAFIFTALFFIFSVLMCVFMPNYARGLTFYMTVSFAVVTFSWFAEQASINNKKRALKFLLILSLGMLCVIFVFRNGTAIDDRHYRNMFSDIAGVGPVKYIIMTFVEPAYVFILAIINQFTSDYIAVQVITGAVPFTIIAVGLVRMRNKLNIALSVFSFITALYFQMVSTNLSRMFFAIAILFYCMDYLFEEENKKYIIGVCIAALFHFSALFMLLFSYLAKNKKIHEKKGLLV